MLQQLVPNDLFSLLLVFARLGSAVMLLPGFGETFVPPRVRLIVALAITLVVTPLVATTLPVLPESPVELAVLFGGEMLIGLFLGSLARFLLTALHIAGVIIGYQTSLGNAMLFDPTTATQGSLIGTFLNIMGVFLIFFANLHHLMLMGVIDSYSLFVPGAAIPVGDFTEIGSRMLGQSFLLAMQISAPFIVVGFIFYLGLGLLARLMPQVQVFFIIMPLQIALGFLILAVTLSAGMMWFLGHFEEHWFSIVAR